MMVFHFLILALFLKSLLSFSDFSFTTISLSGSIFPTIFTLSFYILLHPIHRKISSNSLCPFYISLSIFPPLVSLLFSFPDSLPSVSCSMPPYQRLGVVVLACMITMTALDSLHVHGLPLLSSQFFQLMAGQTDEGLCSLSHSLAL